MSDYLENKIIDHVLRGTAYTAPATTYVGLYTSNPTDAGGGTEVTGGSYARVPVASSLANWAGTQSSGSATISTGSSATTSNNVIVTFPFPSASWGLVSAVGIFDAITSGNLLLFNPLTVSKNVNSGDAAPSFAIGALIWQIDS